MQEPSTKYFMYVCAYVCVCVCVCSVMSDSLQPHGQVPLSMEFSRQEYWSGLPFSTPGGLPNPGIQPMSSVSPALSDGFFTISHTHCVIKKEQYTMAKTGQGCNTG